MQHLKKHIGKVHKKKKPFKCNPCNACFVENGDLKNHIRKVYEKKKPFKCNPCNACFVDNRDLKIHIGKVIITNILP